MIQYNSRVEVNNYGIKFYEQDLLYDDYEYSGDIDIDLNLEYASPGFGVALINNEGNSIVNNHAILFKLGSGVFEILEKDIYNNTKVLFSTSATDATPYKNDLKFKISIRNNKFTFTIGELKLLNLTLSAEINNYIIGYFSSKDNVIKSINIASSIPYDWNINMVNTNGGYIKFVRDGFDLIDCKNDAEIEQMNISLAPGTYYLKFDKTKDSNIIPYVFNSSDKRLTNKEKNLLNNKNIFKLDNYENVNLKFTGTHGSIRNICITSEEDNEYLRTNIKDGLSKNIDRSYVKFLLSNIKYFEFIGTVKNAPGYTHYNPIGYSIIDLFNISYGLYDLKISEEVEYKYVFVFGEISIYDSNKVKRWSHTTGLQNYITFFKNVNGYINNLKIIDNNGNETYFGVTNEITKYVPGLIKSPIVVLDKDRDDEQAKPLNLSSSYRIIDTINGPYYYFTNVEREYFKPNRRIVLENLPSIEPGSIKIYMIDKDANFDLNKILYIPDAGKDTIKDTIDKCVNGQYLIITEDEYNAFGCCVYKETGEIIFDTDLSEYQIIIVDYAVDISTISNSVSVIYDNIENTIGKYEYINEQQYVNSKIIPSENCYIVIGN